MYIPCKAFDFFQVPSEKRKDEPLKINKRLKWSYTERLSEAEYIPSENVKQCGMRNISSITLQDDMIFVKTPQHTIMMKMEILDVVVEGIASLSFVNLFDKIIYTIIRSPQGVVFDRLSHRLLSMGHKKNEAYRFIDQIVVFSSSHVDRKTKFATNISDVCEKDVFSGRMKLNATGCSQIEMIRGNVRYYIDADNFFIMGNMWICTQEDKITIIDGKGNFQKDFKSFPKMDFFQSGVMNPSSMAKLIVPEVAEVAENVNVCCRTFLPILLVVASVVFAGWGFA